MGMPGRSFSSGAYRYGFNGKENDNEVKGQGNQQDYGMRIYDPRLGRFLSTDPLTRGYPMLTPYQFASNTPIVAIDLDGLEAVVYTEGSTGVACSESGHGHSLIAIYTKDDGLLVYSYGRYGKGEEAQSPISGDGYLIKYKGKAAEKAIRREIFKHKDAKAYFIQSAEAEKIKKYFDDKLAKGTVVPKSLENPEEFYDKNLKTNELTPKPNVEVKKVNTYNVIMSRNCVGMIQNALDKTSFDWEDLDEPKKYTPNQECNVSKWWPTHINQCSVQVWDVRLKTTADNDSKKLEKRVEDVTPTEKKSTGSFLKQNVVNLDKK
jgi:RHS repeat-associated protein